MDDFDDFDDILDDLLDDDVDPTDDEDEMFDNEEVTDHVEEDDDDSLDAAMGDTEERYESTPVKPMVDDVPKKETMATSTPATVSTLESASPLSSVSSVQASTPLSSLLSSNTRSESPMRETARDDRKARLEALRQKKAALHAKKSGEPKPAAPTPEPTPAPPTPPPATVTTKPIVASPPKTKTSAPKHKPAPKPKPAPVPKTVSRPKPAAPKPKPAPKPKKTTTPKVSAPSSYKPRAPTRPINMSVANRPTKAWLARQGLLPGQKKEDIGQQKRPGDWLSKTNVKRPKLYHNNISVTSIPNRPTKASLARMAATQQKMAKETPKFSSGMLQTPNGQTFVYRGRSNNMNPQRRH